MRKVIIVVSLVFFIGAVAVAIAVRLRREPSPPAAAPSGTVPISQITFPELSPASIDAFLKASGFPETATITLGTPKGSVTVKNFYRALVDTEEEMVVLRDTDDYRITYDTRNSSFGIVVFGKPAGASRERAERNFLEMLGINQADACKLTASVVLTGDAAHIVSSVSGLSFCVGGVQ